MTNTANKKLLVLLIAVMLIPCFALTFPYVAYATNSASQTQEWNGHRYQIYNVDLCWDDAKAYCDSLQGHLVTITSEEEQQVIEKMLKSFDLEYEGYWMGAAKQSEWKWITGESFTYTKFDSGEPNGSGMYLQIYDSGYWDDTTPDGSGDSGIKQHGFICEWDSIDPIDISKASITLSKSSMTYDGNPKEVGVKITHKFITLKKGRDYTVNYLNNKKIGKATVKITGTGNYTGTVTKSFNIVPGKVKSLSLKNNSVGAIKVKWKKQSGGITGYEVQYAAQKGFRTKSKQTVKKTTVNIKNLSRQKKYYVRVRAYKKIGADTYYGKWSQIKGVKIKK